MSRNSTHVSDGHVHSWQDRLRMLFSGLLLVIGSIGICAYVVVHWAEWQILDTNNWVALVSPLPKQAVVSTTLGQHISDQVFSEEAVEDKVVSSLPPRAVFLAGPLTTQLQQLTTTAAQRLVASDAFQSIWSGANRVAMNRLLSTARGEVQPIQLANREKFNIDLSGTTGQLRQKLGRSSEAIPALGPAGERAVVVSTDLRAKADQLRNAISTIDALSVVLPVAIVTSLLGALAFSRNRRRTALILSVVIVTCMLVELIAVKWLRQETLDLVRNPANTEAVSYIYDTIVSSLKNTIYFVLATASFLSLLLLAGGQSSWAHSMRSFLRIDRLKKGQMVARWRRLRQWFQQKEYYIWLATALVILAYAALFMTVSGQTGINILLGVLGAIAAVHIIATPPQPLSRRSAPQSN